MHSYRAQTFASIFVVLFVMTAVFAQTRGKRTTGKTSVKAVVVAPTPQPEVSQQPAPMPAKRNGRPSSGQTGPIHQGNGSLATVQNSTPAYRYEFAQPDFVISKTVIEHDESGKGTIRFLKRGEDEMMSDPIVVSASALERINNAFTALNFLDSRDEYQYEKDYSHLGNSSFTFRKTGKERTVKFNYTQNKDAKALADEYRKIGQQYIWVFDITFARENQPLDAPKLLDSLDSLIRRNEISDPAQMKDVLTGLADDERIPLIARNHATRLVKKIEKGKK